MNPGIGKLLSNSYGIMTTRSRLSMMIHDYSKHRKNQPQSPSPRKSKTQLNSPPNKLYPTPFPVLLLGANTASLTTSSVPYPTIFEFFNTPPTLSYSNLLRCKTRTGGRVSMKNCLVEGIPDREMKSGRGSGWVKEIKASSIVRTLLGCRK